MISLVLTVGEDRSWFSACPQERRVRAVHEGGAVFPVFPFPPKRGEQSSWIVYLVKCSLRRVYFFVVLKNILLSQISGRDSSSKMVPASPDSS